MKNVMKWFKPVLMVSVLLIAILLTLDSCAEKGGTIEVTNKCKVSGVETPSAVSVFKGLDITGAAKDVRTLSYGETTKFTFDEDGTYTVSAIPPGGLVKTVTLIAGNTEKVTVE
jgi:hypothetical protein